MPWVTSKPGLLGFANVASPLLVEAREDLVDGTTGERHLKDVARLEVTESFSRLLLLPSATLAVPQPGRTLRRQSCRLAPRPDALCRQPRWPP